MHRRIWVALITVTVLMVSTRPGVARPKRAPPVQAVVAALGVGSAELPVLDRTQKAVASAAGQRLLSLCPDCRLSTIDEEGPCGWARAQREVIRKAVAAGLDEEAIVQTYVATYGSQILAIDTSRGAAAASWAVPMTLIALSLVLVFLLGRRLTRAAPAAADAPTIAKGAPSSKDVAALRAELDALD